MGRHSVGRRESKSATAKQKTVHLKWNVRRLEVSLFHRSRWLSQPVLRFLLGYGGRGEASSSPGLQCGTVKLGEARALGCLRELKAREVKQARKRGSDEEKQECIAVERGTGGSRTRTV